MGDFCFNGTVGTAVLCHFCTYAGFHLFEGCDAAMAHAFYNVPSELGGERFGYLSIGQSKADSFEFRYHAVCAEPTKIAALCSARAVTKAFCYVGKVGSCLQGAID